MEGIKKVYLDTSVISALFDLRAPERQTLTHEFWQTIDSYEVYISETVVEEINDSQSPLKDNLHKAITNFKVLHITDEVQKLANEYISNGIFPDKYSDDALHVALASVNGINYLLSWNFKHLVKVKTRRLVSLINAVKEYPPVEIITPPEL
jgi:predicted nucleic acid-binding protein